MSDDLQIRALHDEGEYPQLMRVWRSAVDATHDFLTEQHRAEIEQNLSDVYLPAVKVVVAERRGRLIGFAGTDSKKLEMLFVDAEYRGGGIGSTLLDHVMAAHGVTSVDVNAHNEQAVGFYRRAGFTVTGRSATDDDGRPYPLLHMTVEKQSRPPTDPSNRGSDLDRPAGASQETR
ncbi:acetyltransferase [Brachybacterium sacelli]|uniref:Acetyltransferase n=1 Tax=Brachybacterium sacelli TaxID=173364 RepID=A0ABS4X4E3_9MICO|nr:putative acetyltransferase [Brachybacterium sacelli]